MARNRDGRLIIWPVYFDSSRSRKEGRRVQKEFAVNSPSVDEIFTVSKKLGLSPEIQDEKGHPSQGANKGGRVLVRKSAPKEKIINDIAKGLAKIKR